MVKHLHKTQEQFALQMPLSAQGIHNLAVITTEFLFSVS